MNRWLSGVIMMSTADRNTTAETAPMYSISTAEALLRIEAVLFASETPVPLSLLKQVFDSNVSNSQIKKWIDLLSAQQNNRAIELIETAQGYRFQVRDQFSSLIAQLWPERPIRLSNALLETLAVIAYHQPVTRADIEQIRGVAINSQILRTLFDRQWIVESGVREVPGRPALLSTTKHFLNAFSLQSLALLPSLEQATEALSAFNDNMLLDEPAGNTRQ